MSMSTDVIFLRDKNDAQYQKYLKVFLACKEADADLPEEIDDYFGGDGLDNDPESPLAVSFDPQEWYGDIGEGLEIDVDQIPSGIKTIRFINSW